MLSLITDSIRAKIVISNFSIFITHSIDCPANIVLAIYLLVHLSLIIISSAFLCFSLPFLILMLNYLVVSVNVLLVCVNSVLHGWWVMLASKQNPNLPFVSDCCLLLFIFILSLCLCGWRWRCTPPCTLCRSYYPILFWHSVSSAAEAKTEVMHTEFSHSQHALISVTTHTKPPF